MKKVLLIAGLLFAVGISTAVANEKEVSVVVLNSFNKEFSAAQDVNWVEFNNYYRASFTYSGQNVYAFFSKTGEMLSMARYISSYQLPVSLFSDLKNDYSEYWISDLFEVNNNEGTKYYVTLERADKKLTLSASNGGEWKKYVKSSSL